MSDEHHDPIDMSLEGLLGRILGQDILLRRILLQMAADRAAAQGRKGLRNQCTMLEEWLEESRQLIAQIRIDHPNGDTMKDAARASLEVNLGDVIQAIEDAMRGVH